MSPFGDMGIQQIDTFLDPRSHRLRAE